MYYKSQNRSPGNGRRSVAAVAGIRKRLILREMAAVRGFA